MTKSVVLVKVLIQPLSNFILLFLHEPTASVPSFRQMKGVNRYAHMMILII